MVRKKKDNGPLKVNLFSLMNIILVFIFVLFIFGFSANAGISEDNVTVQTLLDVGNVYPEVLNVSIQGGATDFGLTPNDTTTLYCEARIRDYNGDSDIRNVTAVLFDTVGSSYGASDDNNSHYTNSTCSVNLDGAWGVHADDAYTVLANCTFEVHYYANPEDWNCSVTAYDNESWTDDLNDSITVSELLALGLPDIINYGTVNATDVSNESLANVTNYGNVQINLSLSGYARTEDDDLAMNCSLGSVGEIPIYYEKYNLTKSTTDLMDLAQFESNYTNLSSTPTVRQFELNYRQNEDFNEAVNATYWRIYVPIGVAGSCQGNIVFGATKSPAV